MCGELVNVSIDNDDNDASPFFFQDERKSETKVNSKYAARTCRISKNVAMRFYACMRVFSPLVSLVLFFSCVTQIAFKAKCSLLEVTLRAKAKVKGKNNNLSRA